MDIDEWKAVIGEYQVTLLHSTPEWNHPKLKNTFIIYHMEEETKTCCQLQNNMFAQIIISSKKKKNIKQMESYAQNCNHK